MPERHPVVIFECWLCGQCGTWNRCDYIAHDNCANCWGKRYGFEEVGAVRSDEYIKQIRYFGFDLWGWLSHRQE